VLLENELLRDLASRVDPLEVPAVDLPREVELTLTDGVVELVSASTFQDERGETFYRAIIALDKAYFGEDPRRNRVLPGMSVEADIKTGAKSILSYLLKPVSRGWNNAFHEA